jgi:HEPN domain-containing protein
VNRAELQKLANDRVADAKALLAAKRWSAAYYLAGYAVECGLKACVLAHVERTGVIFEDRKYAEKCWTHDLEELLRLADLQAAFDADAAADSDLRANWDVVTEWSEASRYRRTPKAEAEELYDAVTEKKHGVLSWIKGHW